MAFSAPTFVDGQPVAQLIAQLNTALASIETDLEGKKDNFVENTAFNKNFGTGATNVPTGNSVALLTGAQSVAGAKTFSDAATFSGGLSATSFGQALNLLERSAAPAKPAEGETVIWLSNGTGLGDDGDLMIGGTAGGVSNYGTLFDHSGGTTWS